jgi:two-component system, cell cycle sensor histidine kinase and response regulator CckA
MAPRILDLNQVIGNAAKMLRRLIGEDIQLLLDQAPALGSVLIDPTQMEQVLLNLSLNARDAMPQEGTLTVSTIDVSLDAAQAAPLGLAPGSCVQLAVSEATSGPEALELLGGSPEPVHLVLTDVVMPGLSGRQLVTELARA